MPLISRRPALSISWSFPSGLIAFPNEFFPLRMRVSYGSICRHISLQVISVFSGPSSAGMLISHFTRFITRQIHVQYVHYNICMQ